MKQLRRKLLQDQDKKKLERIEKESRGFSMSRRTIFDIVNDNIDLRHTTERINRLFCNEKFIGNSDYAGNSAFRQCKKK